MSGLVRRRRSFGAMAHIRGRSGSRLRAWGLPVAHRRGRGRAIAAAARKPATVLHRMWRGAANLRFGKGDAGIAWADRREVAPVRDQWRGEIPWWFESDASNHQDFCDGSTYHAI